MTCTGLEFLPSRIHVRAGEDIAIALTAADVMHNLEIDEFDFYVQADAGGTRRAARRRARHLPVLLLADGPPRRRGTGTLVVGP